MKYSMKVSNTANGKEGLISLSGDLTIVHALEIKKVLLEAISDVETLFLDTHEIESMDISFLQIICAFHREAHMSEKKIGFQGDPGDALKELFDRTGYFKQYGCPNDAKKSCMWGEMCQ